MIEMTKISNVCPNNINNDQYISPLYWLSLYSEIPEVLRMALMLLGRKRPTDGWKGPYQNFAKPSFVSGLAATILANVSPSSFGPGI